MENAEEIYHFLEEFSKRKTKTIPQELNEYLAYVARTGDPVYQWSLVKSLFKEKLLNVISDFYETSPGIDIPPYPNVDPFNYDIMKNSLLERLDSFTSAPFTVQRICELLTYPRKQYNRIDKYMRAIEKNILVVSTREPGIQRHVEIENEEPAEPVVNGSDNSEYNVDVEMEDMSWKENSEQQQNSEPQPSSSDTHISINDIEARLQAKQEIQTENQEKSATQYESVTPPELNGEECSVTNIQPNESVVTEVEMIPDEKEKELLEDAPSPKEKAEDTEDMKTEESPSSTLVIPEIKVDDAEMTEQKLIEQSTTEVAPTPQVADVETTNDENKENIESHTAAMDDSSLDSNSKEEIDTKIICEVTTSSEESSSSDTTDNSNSPKTEPPVDIQEEANQSETKSILNEQQEEPNTEVNQEIQSNDVTETTEKLDTKPPTQIKTEDYSISDLKSELPQPELIENKVDTPKSEPDEVKTEDTESKIEEEVLNEEVKIEPNTDVKENESST